MTPVTLLLATLTLAAADATPERRALDYLAREVPRWSTANKCYSCHNNGDAARALFQARKLSLDVPERALADTLTWLKSPERWDKNGGNEAASDKGLARIQFAAALVAALDAGLADDRKPLLQAAEALAKDQRKDGSWKVDATGTGSPVTYGACLATHMARHTLQRADAARYRQAIARSDRWLRDVRVETVLDAAAILLALEGQNDADAKKQRLRCLEVIRKGEAKDGGWGPFVVSPAEPFDTALVMLALLQFPDQDEWKRALARGRRFLIAAQRKDGSWPETTRPPNAESYAQRLSTTGWATQALLATRPR
jgi:hypothetical protein